MLKDIIAKFLNISEHQAEAIIELSSYEKRWKEMGFNKIQTQAGLMKFIQDIGQNHWFKGHDRSMFPSNVSDQTVNSNYFKLFKQLGMVDAVPYDQKQPNPQFSVILGGWAKSLQQRIESFKSDVRQGIIPSQNIVFGLSGNRPLGKSVPPGSEDKIKEELRKKIAENNKELTVEEINKMEITEIDMVNILVSEAVESLRKENPEKFGALKYQPIGVLFNPSVTPGVGRATTGDTVVSLNAYLEEQKKSATLDAKETVNIAVYSNQPFVNRQVLDTQVKLALLYRVIGVGTEMTMESYNFVSNSLGEIARLINTNYKKRESLNELKPFDIPLTFSEQIELSALRLNSHAKTGKFGVLDNKPAVVQTTMDKPNSAIKCSA